MYTVQILFARSLDLYGGNYVSDFLFRSQFLSYGKNQETFKQNCEHNFQKDINQKTYD